MGLRLAAWVLGAVGAVALAGVALAQAGWTTVTKADLAICRPTFAEAHRLEQDYLGKNLAYFCTRGTDGYSRTDCAKTRDLATASSGKDDVDWYFDGNTDCGDSDYPCFGPLAMNQPRSGKEADDVIALILDEAAKPVKITPDMDFYSAAEQGDRCITQVWAKKYRGSSPASSSPSPPAARASSKKNGHQAPGAVAAIDLPTPAYDPPPVASSGRFMPDAPRGSPVRLGQAEAKACESMIRDLQTESQGWLGTLDEISVRLGMMQRTIYAGLCAGHPDADALVLSAEQIITTARPRAASVQTTAEQTTPTVTDCIEPVPPGDKRNPTGAGVFLNTCNFPVYFSYCNVAPKLGSWAEMFACEKPSSVGLAAVPANGMVEAVLGREISHFACRKPALPVATYTAGPGLQGFCK